jgi:hypothetical protein
VHSVPRPVALVGCGCGCCRSLIAFYEGCDFCRNLGVIFSPRMHSKMTRANDRKLPGYISLAGHHNTAINADTNLLITNMKVGSLVSSMLLYAVTFLVQLTSVGGSSSDAIQYTAHQDMTWAVMSNRLSNPAKQAEYDAFMEACRASAEGMAETYCNHDESFRIQMNSEQPRSVRCSVDDYSLVDNASTYLRLRRYVVCLLFVTTAGAKLY